MSKNDKLSIMESTVCPVCNKPKTVNSMTCYDCRPFPNSKPVMITGVHYGSVSKAARETGVSRPTLLYRIKSQVGFHDHFFIVGGEDG